MLLDSVQNTITGQEFYSMLLSTIATTPYTTIVNDATASNHIGTDNARAAVADYTNRFILRTNVC